MKKRVLTEKSEPKKEEKREASIPKSKRASVEKKEAAKKEVGPDDEISDEYFQNWVWFM